MMMMQMKLLVTDRVPEIGFSGTLNHPKNEFLKGKLKMGFLNFFAKFLA